MPDRLKVMKGLIACSTPWDDCDACPYFDPMKESGCSSAMMGDALALLQDQETRLVRHYSRPGVYADLWLHCEKCGGRIDDRYMPKYCPDCGRKVKRDEADDADAPRILTLDELRALPVGAVVWYEQRALLQTYIMPMIVTEDNHIGNWALGVCMDVIGQDDRCWSARPTDEQRKATPWRGCNGLTFPATSAEAGAIRGTSGFARRWPTNT